jgi:hypothetical protein
MTPQEHQLMILVLARVNQTYLAITEMLKSREIITADDLKAFNHASFYDDRQVLAAVVQARTDYLKIAKQAGVEVPPEI